MRTFSLLICLCSLALASGCLRSDPHATVERGGHALVISGNRSDAASAAPGPGESVVILGENQALYQLAEERQVSLRWLIERNDFVRRPGPGDRVILPHSH